MGKKLIAGLVASIASTICGLMAATTVFAYPAESYIIHYYADNTFTSRVGVARMACNGHRTLNGYTTDYSQAEFESCSNGVPAGEIPCAMGVEGDVCHYYAYGYWPEWNTNPPA